MSLALASRRAAISPAWVKNPLWRTARAVPSLDLQFADTKSLADAVTGQSLVTFTRASSGTYVGSDGLIKTAATDEPRFDHNPTTGESLGLLVEESRSNLLLYSNDLDNAWWVKSNSTLTSNAIAAPDGTVTAEKFIPDNGATTLASVVSTNITKAASAISYVFSFFVKAGGFSTFLVRARDSANNANRIENVFNLSTFAVSGAATTGTFTNRTFTYQDFGNGWYRCALGFTTGTETSINVRIAGTAAETGDGTSGIYLWGAQLEAGAFPTSYIPTTTATATRSADVATDTTRGAALRSLFAQFRSPASGTRPIVSLDDNSANNRIELFTSGADPKLLITSGGSAQADLDAGSVTANTMTRLAGRFAADNFAVSVSGGNEITDISGSSPAVDRIRIGRDQAGNYLSGTIARITGWDVPLNVLPEVTQ